MQSLPLLTALLLLTAAASNLPAESLPRLSAEATTEIRALVGKKATITGRVTDAFESPKGMTFLNLEGGKFTLVAWKDNYVKFEGGSPAKLYKGKTIEATGQIFEFRPKSAAPTDPGKLEIKINAPEQIKILTVPDPAADPAADPTPPTPPADPKKAPDKNPTPKAPADPKTTPTPPAADPTKPGTVDPKKYFK